MQSILLVVITEIILVVSFSWLPVHGMSMFTYAMCVQCVRACVRMVMQHNQVVALLLPPSCINGDLMSWCPTGEAAQHQWVPGRMA